MDLRRQQLARVLKGERAAATLTRVGEVIEFA